MYVKFKSPLILHGLFVYTYLIVELDELECITCTSEQLDLMCMDCLFIHI